MEIARVSIVYRTTDEIILPQYKGSTIRGAFGNTFRKVVCPFKGKECKECLLVGKCVYNYVFETPIPSGSKIMRKYEHAPHPFIIEPPLDTRTEYKKDDELTFNLILIGRAIEYLPYFIYTFEMLGEKGIGRGRKKINLVSINQHKSVIYDGVAKILRQPPVKEELKFDVPKHKIKSIKIEFQTPTRIIHQGAVVQNPEFCKIIPNLLRRIALISYFHCDDLLNIDFKGLIKKAETIKTRLEFFKYEQLQRYSGRQKKRIPMDGFVGVVIYEGELTPFYPYLKAGEILHIGKGTAFGMGKYKIAV
ncbi:MAG: CRISPR system precrRNA processing endoribonuclease RAMP protein Cas6 [candidate division WOR-3 bacterium]|nr:CRISPR system precrRNA processing endoribonuclease RAMP protein Cas6 [candidate division WOR-3 bacterium]